MKHPVIVISGTCCNVGCRRVPVRASKFSDFWVTFCEKCSDGQIELDMAKISAAADAAKKLAGAA